MEETYSTFREIDFRGRVDAAQKISRASAAAAPAYFLRNFNLSPTPIQSVALFDTMDGSAASVVVDIILWGSFRRTCLKKDIARHD